MNTSVMLAEVVFRQDGRDMTYRQCGTCGELRKVRVVSTATKCKRCCAASLVRKAKIQGGLPPELRVECRGCGAIRMHKWLGLKHWRQAATRLCYNCAHRVAMPQQSDQEPLDWELFDVDWAVVARLISGAGKGLRTNRLERQLAVAALSRRMSEHGRPWSSARIAEHMGISDRTVIRLRRHQRLMPVTLPAVA